MSNDVDSVRLSVLINQETAKALRQLAKAHGKNATEVTANAILLTKMLYDEQDSGKTIRTVNKRGGKSKELHLL